jgi:hypothetical protein
MLGIAGIITLPVCIGAHAAAQARIAAQQAACAAGSTHTECHYLWDAIPLHSKVQQGQHLQAADNA